jgi:hypothetical protein
LTKETHWNARFSEIRLRSVHEQFYVQQWQERHFPPTAKLVAGSVSVDSAYVGIERPSLNLDKLKVLQEIGELFSQFTENLLVSLVFPLYPVGK